MYCIGRAQWLIIFLAYPIYTISPCHIRYSFININCSFRNSMEVFIPANFSHHFIFPVVLRKAAGGKKSLYVFGCFCFVSF